MSNPVEIRSAAPPADLAGAWLAALWPVLGDRLSARLALKDLTTGSYLWLDPALATAWGTDAATLEGGTDADCFDAATAAVLRAADQAAAGQAGVLASSHRFEAGGSKHDAVVLRLAGPGVLACVWIDQLPLRQREAQLRNALDQIEQLQQANEALRGELGDQALRDADSGLFTRGHFEDQLRREVDLSTREHREFALVCIEIDPPTEAVRTLGPAAQSRIHEAMGRLLRGNTRAMDASCRFDARRFGVLLSGVGLATAHSRMEGLRRQCATQVVVHDGVEIGFTAAVGVASFPHTAHTRDELVLACESALVEAQRRGGNHVTLASIRLEAP